MSAQIQISIWWEGKRIVVESWSWPPIHPYSLQIVTRPAGHAATKQMEKNYLLSRDVFRIKVFVNPPLWYTTEILMLVAVGCQWFEAS